MLVSLLSFQSWMRIPGQTFMKVKAKVSGDIGNGRKGMLQGHWKTVSCRLSKCLIYNFISANVLEPFSKE